MKLWKSRSSGNKRRESEKEDLVSRLKKDVPMMRGQGEPPDKDPAHFSGFLCDLCNSPFAYHELRQCILCGRWACSSCWTPEFYVCNSCNGMITLHTMGDKSSR
ncbi:MAG TPA: hypothetical protein PKM87_00995 [Methanolinea sp.]|nr:hypothetical protein [Methanolinea sp.]HNS82178.1 hypothetical protein [Methanolinea sp.]